MVPRGGIEPPTQGFSVPCSTYWATEAFVNFWKCLHTTSIFNWRPGRGSNPRPPAWQAGVLTNCTTGPQIWWAFKDLNPGPIGYEPTALTNWAKGPKFRLQNALPFWSGWRDSNSRPHGPKPRALPNCATPRCFNISLIILQYFFDNVNNF